MPAPVLSGLSVSPGFVGVILRPPLEFITRQSGAFGRALGNLIPLWERFGPVMAAIEREQFSSHGHGGWAPLAASTLADKARHGYPPDPLVRTGKLRDELTSPGSLRVAGPRSAVFGTRLPYARWHQEGTPRMPARALFDLSISDRRALESAIVSWLNEQAALHWRAA